MPLDPDMESLLSYERNAEYFGDQRARPWDETLELLENVQELVTREAQENGHDPHLWTVARTGIGRHTVCRRCGGTLMVEIVDGDAEVSGINMSACPAHSTEAG